MQVRHSVPADEVDDHCLDHPCPCEPEYRATAEPGKRPIAHLIHQPFNHREKP